MAGRSRRAETVDIQALVTSAKEKLAEDGAVKLSSLGPKASRGAVADALAALGFEVTRTAVRRPLTEQLRAALAGGAYLPVKSLPSLVSGATPAELKAAVAALVGGGAAHRVLRGSAEVLIPGGEAVLGRDELVAARRAVDAAAKWLAKASKGRGVTVLHADVEAELQGVLPESRKSATPGREQPKGQAHVFERVLTALDATRDEAVGLSFIPEVVRHLEPQVSAEQTRAMLVDAERRGIVELRPEGGLGRLSAEELSLCVPGPQGTRLSWARRIERRIP